MLNNKVKKENKYKTKHGIDFIDEKVISFEELEDNERIACKLASNIITGSMFVLMAFISMLF